jgi:uncharacterized caspase-like protein
MRRILATILFACLLASLAAAQDKLAVVIGVNNYDTLSGLKAGVNDAEKIAAYYNGIGFKVWLIDDRQEARMNQPSLVNLERVMDNVREAASGKAPKELVFFFAGHGVQIDGQNWLCFPETQLQGRVGMMNVDTRLLPWLRNLGANLTMVYLDACRNDLGAMRAAGVERGLSVVGLANEPQAGAVSSNGRNLAVFYAAKPGSFSYEKPDGTNGFFTDTLLEALQADSTRTIADLYSYMRTALPERTEKAYGKPQTPNLGGDLDILAGFSKGKVDLSALDSGGKVFVETDQPGATILVNGVKRGVSPMLVEKLDPGAATIEAVKDGLFASTQISVALKSYTRVSLTLEKLRGDILLQSVRSTPMGSNDATAVVDMAEFVTGMELRIDGKTIATANGVLFPDLEPGTHSVSLTGKGWTWDDTVAIKPREAVKLDPVFVPAATLELEAPSDSSLAFVNQADGSRLEMDGATDTIKDFPPGNWSVVLSGRRYQETRTAVKLDQGGSVSLKLAPALKPAFSRGQEVQILKDGIAKAQVLLPGQRASRSGSDGLGVVGIGLAAAGLVTGGVFAVLSYTAFLDYQAATTTASATQKRADSNQWFTLAIPVASGGLGVGLGLSLIGFLGGEHPAATEAQITGTQAKIKLLEDQGVDY